MSNTESITKKAGRVRESQYFSHDVNAQADEKIDNLIFEMGHEGVGLYWCLVEKLYCNDGYLRIDNPRKLAHSMRAKESKVMRVITEFNLFRNDSKNFWSDSVLRRIEIQRKKSEDARNKVNKRYGKDTTASSQYTEKDTEVAQQYSSNATIKEINETKETKETYKQCAEGAGETITLWPDQTQQEAEIKKEKEEGPILLPHSDGFKAAWAEWETYRKEKRATLTPTTVKKQLASLAKLSEKDAVDRINQSIQNGWQGLFEVKTGGNPAVIKMKNGQYTDEKGFKRMVIQ
jgi:hypothetical protein